MFSYRRILYFLYLLLIFSFFSCSLQKNSFQNTENTIENKLNSGVVNKGFDNGFVNSGGGSDF